MEPNQNPAQEQPVQPIVPQTTRAAQQPDIEQIVAPAMEPAQPAAQSAAQPAPQPQPQPGRPDELLYDPNEAAQMIRNTSCFSESWPAARPTAMPWPTTC